MITRNRKRLPLEIVDVLGDDPDLVRLAGRIVALADDEAARPRRWRLVRVVASAATTAVALGLAIFFVAGERPPSLSDRALAAIDRSRVLHTVLVRRIPYDRTVDLRTGREVSAHLTIESWLDLRTGRLHLIERRNSALLSDVLGSRRLVAKGWRLDPAIVRFTFGYKNGLEKGRVRDVGSAMVNGQNVHWLQLPSNESVAVDANSFLPLLIREPDGTEWTVARIENIPRAAADFRAPAQRSPVYSGGHVVEQHRISASAVPRVLGVPALWFGPRTPKLQLAAFTIERLVDVYVTPHRAARHSRGIAIIYRVTSGAGVLQLYEARQPVAAYAFNDHLTFGFDAIPAAGRMQLLSTGGGWLGQLRTHRLYVTLIGSNPAIVVQAARQLRPVRR